MDQILGKSTCKGKVKVKESERSSGSNRNYQENNNRRMY